MEEKKNKPNPSTMSPPREGRFPDWRKVYDDQSVETMPWFSAELDPDLEREIVKRRLTNGTFLDIGTGPGTQAAQLTSRGFRVTGTDISAAAVRKARERFPEVQFFEDDILQSRLTGPIDFAFDRGCFHVLAPEDRPTYVTRLQKMLAPDGLLFLKCFSVAQEAWDYGPWRFSEEDIRRLFEPKFRLLSSQSSSFIGTLEPAPKALFCVLQRA